MKNKRFISLITILAMCMSLFANITIFAESETYTADFTKLEAKTYGTAEDIIKLDDYTTAYLTHEGTYVDSNHVIHLTGTNAGKGAYTNGSYLQFTAPSDGTVSFTINYANYFVDETYKDYSSASVDLKAEQTLTIGERDTTQSTISAITFTPKQTPTVTEIATPYTSPQTTWDFDTYLPAESGKNVPVITGAAEYNDGNIKFKSNDKATGTLSVDFDEPIKNNVEFSFDVTEHKDSNNKYTLNGRYIEYKILNSEDEEIAFFSTHPYDANSENSNLIKIGGTEISKTKSEILTAFNNRGTGIRASVDYHSRKVTITMGSNTFEGEIPASAMKDIAKFEFSVKLTSSVSADRYITLDNLSVKEFTSTAPAAPAGEITNGYEEKTFGGMNLRVKALSDSTGKPLVVFLSSKSRFGTDNEGQLYQAQCFFDKLTDNAILAAPQAANTWSADALKAYIEAAKSEYSPTEVVVIGYDEGATAAYSLSDTADKIIPISGGGNVYGKVKAKYWAFGGFLDDTVSIADIRKPVNALQTAGAKVRYTEYPTDKHNLLEKASNETGVIDWIKGDVTDKKVVDLVLFAGQSNMAGRGDYTAATECPPGEGFEFHSITNPKLLSTEAPLALSLVSEPFGKNDNNAAINDDSGEVDRRKGDMVSSLMKAYYEKTGVPIVGVQASRGGEPSSYFTDAERKTEMLSRYNAAVEYLAQSGYVVRKKFMVWCQGESDAEKGRTESSYKTNTLAVFDNVKTAGITEIFMIKTGHRKTGDLDAQYIEVNGWQQDIIDDNDDVYGVANLLTDEYKEQMIDNFHYPQAVYNEVGTTVGEAIAEIYKSETTPPEPEETEVIMPLKKPSITVNSSTSVTVKADTDNDDSPVLIHVTRGGNLSIKTYDLTFDGDTAAVNNLSLKNGDELYVWNSLSGMKSLADKKIVTEISQSVQ